MISLFLPLLLLLLVLLRTSLFDCSIQYSFRRWNVRSDKYLLTSRDLGSPLPTSLPRRECQDFSDNLAHGKSPNSS